MKLKRSTLHIAALIGFFWFFFPASAKDCDAGKSRLFFLCDSSIDSITRSGFSLHFFDQLQKPLNEIGYCFTLFDSLLLSDSSKQNDLVMYLSCRPQIEFDSTASVIIGLLKVGELSEENLSISLQNPLIFLFYAPGELTTFESVLTKKTIENLRTQYVCHLRIQSSPDGVKIRTETGLEGATPLEWILPVGDLVIDGNYNGYESLHRKLDLNEPGIHTLFLQMRKRQFYDSKFMYPAVISGLVAAACYVVDRYYYSSYLRLAKERLLK